MKKKVIREKDKLYFTSDQHFGHERIIKLCERVKELTHVTIPIKDAKDMNEYLIKRWNDTVPKEATVIDLGDFMFRLPKDQAIKILKRLNFKEIVFLKGNHGREYYSLLTACGRKVSIIDEADLLHVIVEDEEFDDDKCDLICCHYPIVEWPLKFRGALHLYGHTHRDHPAEQPGSLHVGVDTNGLAPISYINALAKIYKKGTNESV